MDRLDNEDIGLSSGKFFASNPLNDLFGAVTDNFNCFDSRVGRGFNWHALSPFLPGQSERLLYDFAHPSTCHNVWEMAGSYLCGAVVESLRASAR
jgi:hypothetical protein